MAGKGDKPRPRDPKLWSEGYDTAFGRQVKALRQLKIETAKEPMKVKQPQRG